MPCPRTAPDVRHPSEQWELCRGVDQRLEGRGCSRHLFILEERFTGPAGYRGIDAGRGVSTLGHLVISAAPTAASEGTAAPPYCPDPTPAGHDEIGGITAEWYDCRGGAADPNAGHVLLVWEMNGITYGVGLHGHSATNRRLVQAVADDLLLVG